MFGSGVIFFPQGWFLRAGLVGWLVGWLVGLPHPRHHQPHSRRFSIGSDWEAVGCGLAEIFRMVGLGGGLELICVGCAAG